MRGSELDLSQSQNPIVRILDSVSFVWNVKDFTYEPHGLFYDDSGEVADAVAEIILAFRLYCSSLTSSPYGNRAGRLLAFYRTVTANGNFQKVITLFPGNETITVKATNRFGKETTIQRTVVVR